MVTVPFIFADKGGLEVPAAELDANFAALATAIAAGAQPYANLAALNAATVDSGVQSVVTLGRVTAGDGGGSQWLRVTTAIGRGLATTSNGGAIHWGSISTWMTWQMFGIFPTVADNAPACGLVATELVFRSLNGMTPWIRGPAGLRYPVYPVKPPSQTRLMDLTAASGISPKILLGGSAFRCSSNLISGTVGDPAGPAYVYGILMRGAYKPEIEVTFIQDICTNDAAIVAAQPGTVLGGPNFNGGIWGVFAQDTIIQPKLNVNMQGGVGNVVYARSTDRTAPLLADQRAIDGEHNIVSKNVFYPYNARNNGDNMVGTIRSYNAGRSFFTYNNWGSTFLVDSVNHAGGFDDILIKCYGNTLSAYDSQTLNHTVKVTRSDEASTVADDSCVFFGLDQQQPTPAPCVFVNNRVEVNGNYTNMVDPGNFWAITKVNSAAGGSDNTHLPHVLAGNVVSGHVSGWNNVTYEGNVIAFVEEDWTGAHVSGTGFDNMTFEVAGGFLPNVALDGRAFGDGHPFLTENTHVAANTFISNPAPGMLDALADFTTTDLTGLHKILFDIDDVIPVGTQFVLDSSILTADRNSTIPPGGVNALVYYRTGSGFARHIGGTTIAGGQWVYFRYNAGAGGWYVQARGGTSALDFGRSGLTSWNQQADGTYTLTTYGAINPSSSVTVDLGTQAPLFAYSSLADEGHSDPFAIVTIGGPTVLAGAGVPPALSFSVTTGVPHTTTAKVTVTNPSATQELGFSMTISGLVPSP